MNGPPRSFALWRTMAWCAWAALIVFIGWQSWSVWNRWQERREYVSCAEIRQGDLRQLTVERDRQREELDRISRELETMAPVTRQEFAHDSALSGWLNRVERLKGVLAENPQWKIPEMSYLTSNDWLSVTLENSLSTNAEIRNALSKLREMAKAKPQMGPNFFQALYAFARAHEGRFPEEVAALIPFLKPELPNGILTRYRVPPKGSPSGATVDSVRAMLLQNGPLVLEEVDPVDDDYDTQLIFMDGGWSLYQTSKVGEAVGDASSAYEKANPKKRPENADQLLPYLASPVDLTRLREYWAVTHPR